MTVSAQPTLPDFELVPEATPATPDLVCWIWAAFPPHRGTINQTRVADALGVSRRTLGRWLADAQDRSFDKQTRAELARRAILRGHGTYLWPDLDPATRYRNHGQTRNAYIAYQAITDDTYPDAWRTNGTLDEHQVLQLWYPDAHVYGIAVVSNDKALAKIKKDAEILQVRHTPNKYAGLLIKHALQATRAGHRCIAPRTLVKTGRTETWRENGGPGRLPASAGRVFASTRTRGLLPG